MSQDRVGICGVSSPTILGGPAYVCDLPADHAGWHGADNLTSRLMPPTRASWWWSDDHTKVLDETIFDLGTALAEVASLRQQLDEARAKIEDRRLRLVHCEGDLLNIRGILSPNGGVSVLPPDMEIGAEVAPVIEWLVREFEETRTDAERVEADRDRLLDVYRAAGGALVLLWALYEAWRDTGAEPTPGAYEAAIDYLGRHIDIDPDSNRWLLDDQDVRGLAEAIGAAGVAAGRAQAAADIRNESLTWCMDGLGRHLVSNCARVAERGEPRGRRPAGRDRRGTGRAPRQVANRAAPHRCLLVWVGAGNQRPPRGREHVRGPRAARGRGDPRRDRRAGAARRHAGSPPVRATHAQWAGARE